jgi:hypothetical protein
MVAALACGQDKIDVRQGATADYNHGALLAAVDKFVAAGRTPVAYAQLSQTAFELRGGMDHAVAQEAELKLIVLALGPVESVHQKPIADQIDALALTVWPTLLAPIFEADQLVDKFDPRNSATMPMTGEQPRAYLVRLCGGPLTSDCKQTVPELQGPVVSAIAIRKATERARNSIAECVMCGADPGWHEAVRAWESLDRAANSTINEIERQADPDNWPIAGNAAEAQVEGALPEAEILETGELVIGGQHFGPLQRVVALRDLRGSGNAIALHLHPEMSLAQVHALLGDVNKSGASRVAVVARAPRYPWDRKIYWIADRAGTPTGLRPTDSLQLLLHAVDAVASPGAIARVD